MNELSLKSKYRKLKNLLDTYYGENVSITEMRQRALHKYVDDRLAKLEYTKWRRSNIKKIFDRDGGICLYCHCKLDKKTATLDHLNPPKRGLGGRPTDASNVAICCSPCNNKKGMLTAEEYINNVIFSR